MRRRGGDLAEVQHGRLLPAHTYTAVHGQYCRPRWVKHRQRRSQNAACTTAHGEIGSESSVATRAAYGTLLHNTHTEAATLQRHSPRWRVDCPIIVTASAMVTKLCCARLGRWRWRVHDIVCVVVVRIGVVGRLCCGDTMVGGGWWWLGASRRPVGAIKLAGAAELEGALQDGSLHAVIRQQSGIGRCSAGTGLF